MNFALGLFCFSLAPALGELILSNDPVEGEWVVVLADPANDVDMKLQTLLDENINSHELKTSWSFDNKFQGGVVSMNLEQAQLISELEGVKYVEQHGYVHMIETQNSVPSWGIDRVDERELELDGFFTYLSDGSGVNAYVIDSGIRDTHNDFGGRAFEGPNFTGDGNPSDCNGHGTHVAGTVAGSTVGVAKGANVFGVKVFTCSGGTPTAVVIAGIDYVRQQCSSAGSPPCVANMSLGGGSSQALIDATTALIDSGVPTAVAAGNENSDACFVSPANTPSALTVGSTTISDTRSSFSNFGPCVDLFAPGSNIFSSWWTGDEVFVTISGTSMASPHVAGIAALVKGVYPDFTSDEVNSYVKSIATKDVVNNPNGAPNLLAFAQVFPFQPSSYWIACGKVGSCVEGTTKSGVDEMHGFRCCSDSETDPSDAGWTFRKNGALCPWVTTPPNCDVLPATLEDAASICASAPGASRLCTLPEVEGNCAKGGGCSLNTELIWTSSETPHFWAACGKTGGCSGDSPTVVEEDSTLGFRCCSDSASDPSAGGWTFRKNESFCPWVATPPSCGTPLTHEDAMNACAGAPGAARLCSVSEIDGNCARGGGCGLNQDLIWSETAVTFPYIDVGSTASADSTQEESTTMSLSKKTKRSGGSGKGAR